jgi:osmotically-inducible protein OsmY
MQPTFHKTDAQIQTQIGDELHWDCRTDGSPISVQVTQGHVTLTGIVKTYAVKVAAEEATHRIAGVHGVTNDIQVKIPYLVFKADMEITQAVEFIFAWNVLIPHENLSVSLANGFVTIVGTVDCWSQREEAERAVTRLAGVKGVNNRIRVRPTAVETQSVCSAIEATLDRYAPQETQGVHVAVEAGTVRLTGEVTSWGERVVAIQTAGFAPGVTGIVDELTVVGA